MKLSEEVAVHRNSISIFVPSTISDNEGNQVGNAGSLLLPQRVREVSRFIAGWLGGFTTTQHSGGWIGEGGEIIEEAIIEVEGFATDNVSTFSYGGGETEEHPQSFDEWVDEYLLPRIKGWRLQWQQESIGLKVNGVFYVIYGD